VVARALLVALRLSFLATCACDDEEPVSADEQAWAEDVTGQIARFNDVMSLQVLLAVVPDAGDSDVVAVGDERLDPDWVALATACDDVAGPVAELDALAASAPSRYVDVGSNVSEFADAIEQFAAECSAAADAQDVDLLQASSSTLDRLSEVSAEIGRGLPADIGCPSDIPDRPQTCDA
jgi:hypothetical protein